MEWVNIYNSGIKWDMVAAGCDSVSNGLFCWLFKWVESKMIGAADGWVIYKKPFSYLLIFYKIQTSLLCYMVGISYRKTQIREISTYLSFCSKLFSVTLSCTVLLYKVGSDPLNLPTHPDSPSAH